MPDLSEPLLHCERSLLDAKMLSMNSTSEPTSTSLVLSLRTEVIDPVDADNLRADVLAKLSRDELHHLPLSSQRSKFVIGDLFEVIGDPSEHIVVQGDGRYLNKLGCGMKSGRLTIMGNAGHECGLGLDGGMIEVFGDVGHRLAQVMRRGRMTVHGNAGDCVCGPTAGSTQGMRGGDCLILGNAGHRIAERMRRGVLFIQGNAGDYGAVQMIAGTLVAMGGIGQHWAQGMRRGTLILASEHPTSFDAVLTPAGEFELSFLPLLWKYLHGLVDDLALRLPLTRWANRQIGDRVNQGLGEVLTLTRSQMLSA
jgi:formylmethanofuran dehydrogenase subunit C